MHKGSLSISVREVVRISPEEVTQVIQDAILQYENDKVILVPDSLQQELNPLEAFGITLSKTIIGVMEQHCLPAIVGLFDSDVLASSRTFFSS